VAFAGSGTALGTAVGGEQVGAPFGGSPVVEKRRSTLRFVVRNPKAITGAVILVGFIVVSVLAPELAPYDPGASDFLPYLHPSTTHLLGTTGTGQDVWSQFIWGGRVTLEVAFVAGGLTTALSTLVGLVSGALSGLGDELVTVVTNIFLVIPALPLMVVLAAYINVQGILPIIAVIVVTSWAWGARMIRAQVASLRSREYITFARLSGERFLGVLWREVLPNIISLVSATFLSAAIAAILAESALQFLGLGDPLEQSWGNMLYWANNGNALLNGQWGWVLAPGLAIALTGGAFALLNFGLDEIISPRMRDSRS
jgi:peptide/nickel transport system permease protein